MPHAVAACKVATEPPPCCNVARAAASVLVQAGAAAHADADHGDQGPPFVSLLKEYMARAPAPLAAAGGSSVAGGRSGSTAGAPGAGADALMHAASREAHRLLELAGRAAERQAQMPASSSGLVVPSSAPAAVQAAADESWQVRPCLGVAVPWLRRHFEHKRSSVGSSVVASWPCREGSAAVDKARFLGALKGWFGWKRTEVVYLTRLCSLRVPEAWQVIDVAACYAGAAASAERAAGARARGGQGTRAAPATC